MSTFSDSTPGLDNRSEHIVYNQQRGKTERLHTAEDIQEMIRSLNLNPPKQPEHDALYYMPPFTMANVEKNARQFNPTSPIHHHVGANRASTTHINDTTRIFTSASHTQSRSTSSSTSSQEEDKQMPLPIGTEKKLGLIEKTQAPDHKPAYTGGFYPPWRSPAYRFHDNDNSIMSVPHKHLGYIEERDLPNRQERQDRNENILGQWHRHNQEIAKREALSNRISANCQTTSLSSPNSSTDGNYGFQNEYNFSDFATTPGFGGFRPTYGKSSYDPPQRKGYQHEVNFLEHQAPAYQSRANLEHHLNQIAYEDAARSASRPMEQLRYMSDQSRYHNHYNNSSRAGMPTHNRYLSNEELIRTPTYGDDAMSLVRQQLMSITSAAPSISRRATWSTAQYSNSEFLPTTWVPGLDTGPPAPATFAPGDWICKQPYCGYHNFQKNPDCRACGHPRPWESFSHPSHSNHGPPLGSVGDWKCDCGFINWRRRQFCKSCWPDEPSNKGEDTLLLQHRNAQRPKSWGSSDEISWNEASSHNWTPHY
ncbi:uncharacterized protein L201_000899 [Kwoniella dendrophila CBS 6074]|uniref:RanBP2-type domain-containing protein n=1 Tax=Kwoniella dendrophila CBS 6074 TaxID=1295534 RepID=A0AAX4JM71_9TREE